MVALKFVGPHETNITEHPKLAAFYVISKGHFFRG
jgi:hypothetical protein